MNKTTFYPLALALMLSGISQVTNASPASQDVAAIRHISGGIGEEDLESLEMEQRDYRLKMMFTTLDGSYLADIEVLVMDHLKNTILTTHSSGPVMLLNLPSGVYQVQASYGLETVSKQVQSVPNHLNTVYFRFSNR